MIQRRCGGERTLPPVRRRGVGVHGLIQRSKNLHFTYELELPQSDEPNVERQATYILSIKNSDAQSPPGAALSERNRSEHQVPLRTQQAHCRAGRSQVHEPALMQPVIFNETVAQRIPLSLRSHARVPFPRWAP